MVIAVDTRLDRKAMALVNEFSTGVVKWNERPTRLQHKFLVLRKLGQGTYGKVQLALNKETNEEVAIKTIRKAKIESEEDMLRIRREIHIMASIRHRHIIHINEVFETRQKIVIVMQYASGGELYDYLGCHNTLPEEEARRLFRQIASAIYYCHMNKICHRDLKLENILLDEEGNAQIADFGLSNIFDDRRRMNTFCGSPLYASPEIVKGTPYKGPEVDCWSLGVLLYTLIFGTMPFDGRNFKDLVSQISEGRYQEPPNKSNASSLIRRLLTPDIAKRATISDVCQDAWVNHGHEESLLRIAEKMTSDSIFNPKNLELAKVSTEKIPTQKCKTSFLRKLASLEKQNGGNALLANGGDNGFTSDITESSLYEQILNYDVSFVITKLLLAVDNTLQIKETQDHSVTLNILNGKHITTMKPWSLNNDKHLPSKVDSAYVIPIFEVNSVMPKGTRKENMKENGIKNDSMILETVNFQNPKTYLKKGTITNKKDKKKELSNLIQSTPSSTKISDSEKFLLNNDSKVDAGNKKYSLKNENIKLHTKHKNIAETETLNLQSSFSIRNSFKGKRSRDIPFTGNKYFGTFSRSKNHSLSLARIFSMKYEKLFLDSLKLPEKKLKLPGKVVIPASFETNISADQAYEKKEIVVFPTVSVSENKEKIEKKIDKIKKAALNMNLIRRSSSKNRLKIQKYLKSQAKKIQDLVCEEQRSASGSCEHLNRVDAFLPLSDSCYAGLEKGALNCFPNKLNNKKINFFCSDKTNNALELNDSVKKWKAMISNSLLLGGNQDNECFSIIKSKSDTIFATYSIKDDNFSRNKACVNALHIPTYDCNGKIIRSSSDSDCLVISKNTCNHDKKKISVQKKCDIEIAVHNIIFQNLQDHEREQSLAGTSEFHVCDKISVDESTAKNLADIGVRDSRNENYFKMICSNNRLKIPAEFQNAIKNKYFGIKHCSSTSLLDYTSTEEDKFKNKLYTTDKTKVSPNLSDGETLNNLSSKRRKGLRRRNTMNSFSADNDSNSNPFVNCRGLSTDNCSDFQDNLFSSQSANELTREKNETKFLSSPNLNQFPLSENLYNGIKKNYLFSDKDSKDTGYFSVDDIPQDRINSATPSMQMFSDKSSYFRRMLLENNIRSPDSFTCSSPRRAKSNDKFYDDGNDFILEHDIERDFCLSKGHDKSNQVNTPFLSKFLNELENRDNFSKVKNSCSDYRQYPRNALLNEKRSKMENRKKSFLQLLSLKRIQEAEKELDRNDKDERLEEEEGNEGSLLEALKMHGYKGVISQRFQGSENESIDTYGAYNSISPVSARKFHPDISRFSPMYYDSLTHDSTPVYNVSDLSNLNLNTPLDANPVYKQNTSKQLVCDWLTANQNGEYSNHRKINQEYRIPVEGQSAINESCNALGFIKETQRSFEDEASSLESYELPAVQYTNGMLNGEESETKTPTFDCVLLPKYSKMEAYTLRRTSSTSDDEESVQDRIWRKSFYSRFNNSALSRKEKTFIDPQFSSESRIGFNVNRLSPFKISHRDSSANGRSNGNIINSHSRRMNINAVKKYSSSNDKEFGNYNSPESTSSEKYEPIVNGTFATAVEEVQREVITKM